MTDTVIKVEDLWKQYRLGHIDAISLKEDIQYWWKQRILHKRNLQTGRIIDENDLLSTHGGQDFWALKDINFEVQKGEVFGIIGKNGAGKSTLLKLLSRITRPTRGTIKGKGNMASLLEVGTGFHEELTGKENIYLNGNILGMSNREIKEKFDAIVDFSGVAKFIDTPVKRYSSGMYVRLAFAVAAHLEPDILIVDEVLSVGDTEFQEKCLAKMHEIALSRGCTIIYVSHHMPSILQLCNRALLLKQGRMIDEGPTRRVINSYYELLGKRRYFQAWETGTDAPGNELIQIKKVALSPELLKTDAEIDVRTPLHIHFEFQNYSPDIDLSVGIHLFTTSGECIFDVSSPSARLTEGNYEGTCIIPGNFLNDGAYYISIIFVKNTNEQIYYLERCLAFDVADFRGNIQWQGKWMGAVRPQFPVHITPLKSEGPV